jgi:hypothetical protein
LARIALQDKDKYRIGKIMHHIMMDLDMLKRSNVRAPDTGSKIRGKAYVGLLQHLQLLEGMICS